MVQELHALILPHNHVLVLTLTLHLKGKYLVLLSYLLTPTEESTFHNRLLCKLVPGTSKTLYRVIRQVLLVKLVHTQVI